MVNTTDLLVYSKMGLLLRLFLRMLTLLVVYQNYQFRNNTAISTRRVYKHNNGPNVILLS